MRRAVGGDLEEPCVYLGLEMSMSRYALYGGSFDPIHFGHLSMVERAVALGYEVIMAPAYRHAFGKQLTALSHRLRMCELALQATGLQVHSRVCALERRLGQDRRAPVYTYSVLCSLRETLRVSPCLLVGPDIGAEWERWYRHDRIDAEFGRLCLPVTQPIRSTEIRQAIRSDASSAVLQAFMPEPVVAYIITHRLYR